jgi:glycosyltransferase involved in cell wall biosynthesis
LKVLFLAPQPFFEVRGTPLAVRALCTAVAGLGHEVDLLTFPQGTDLEMAGVRHRRSLRLPVGKVKAGASFAKLCLDVPFLAEAVMRMAGGGYDLVHAVEEAAPLVAPFTRLFGIPLVSDVDSAIPEQLRYSGFARRGPLPWLAERLETHALRHSVAVVTVCASLTDRVRARAAATPVFQIEDPPLVDGAAAEPGAVAALRTALGLAADAPVVLYSGNFEPYQGVDLLVEAAALVPEAEFVFMGGEPAEVEALRGATAGRSRSFFSGKRPPAELPAFLGLADVLVSPRRQGDNTPFKIYTYLASGRPLVATRIPTHTQLLDDRVAFLVEPTAAGLAAGIRDALLAPDEAKARAFRGRELIERDYSPARYAQKVRAAYAEVENRIQAR